MTDPLATLGFVRNRLDRHSAEQPEETVPPLDAEGAGLLILGGDRFLLRGGTAIQSAATLPHAVERTETVFLGRWDGRPVFAASIPADELPTLEGTENRSLDLRSIATDGTVEAEELGLLAVAKSMLDWHGRHRFSAPIAAHRPSPRLEASGGNAGPATPTISHASIPW